MIRAPHTADDLSDVFIVSIDVVHQYHLDRRVAVGCLVNVLKRVHSSVSVRNDAHRPCLRRRISQQHTQAEHD